MSLDAALQTSISTIPECVAGGYVDMSTGMLLAVKTVDSHPAEVLDLVAAATADLFQGPNVIQIETLFDRSRGITRTGGGHYFQEIIVFSDNLLHVFMRGKKYHNHAVTYVCRKNANIGMVLTKARMALGSLEDAL